MKEAIVTEGNERGRTVKICAEPTCRVHFPDRREPDPKQIEREKEARRKELLKKRFEATVRHRVFAEVLHKVSAPLERADLVLLLQILLEQAHPVRRETLARRHKLAASQLTSSDKVHKELLQLLRRLDESGLSKLLVEWVLMDDVENVSSGEPEYLNQAAKQHKVDLARVRASVEKEFTTKEAKATAKLNKQKQASGVAKKPATAIKKTVASKKTRAAKQAAA